jgi:hypothetical protein
MNRDSWDLRGCFWLLLSLSFAQAALLLKNKHTDMQKKRTSRPNLATTEFCPDCVLPSLISTASKLGGAFTEW